MKYSWLVYVLYFALGTVLNIGKVTLATWQFWAILVIVIAIDCLAEIKGCFKATGEYPWNVE